MVVEEEVGTEKPCTPITIIHGLLLPLQEVLQFQIVILMSKSIMDMVEETVVTEASVSLLQDEVRDYRTIQIDTSS